jgi:hypothetical protein
VRAARCSPPFNLTDTDNGYVTIMGISNKAAPVVRDTLRVGDRVVSVESSVGATIWEVSTTGGLTSAVTARLPGQPVRIVFERVAAREDADAVARPPAQHDAVPGFRRTGATASAVRIAAPPAPAPLQPGAPTAAQAMLLSRSRDLLRMYITRKEVTKNL